MNNLTIITGKQGSGKSTKAKEITANKKALWLTELQPGWVKELQDETEVVILDECNWTRDKMSIMDLISQTTISYRKPYEKEKTTRKTPYFIICTNDKVTNETVTKGTVIINL